MLVSLLLGLIGTTCLKADDRPNILWIFVEDLSPWMGSYGDPINQNHTPTIDQMAKKGVLFSRTYMPAPVCSACRSAIITGVMQTTTGTQHHRSSRTQDGKVVPEELRIYLPKGMKTLPELFRDAGYFTFNQGKDDYNFHYDRRQLYSVGTEKRYQPGQNGWQGNSAEKMNSFTQGTWRERSDKTQPWFGQILLWGGKAGDKHVRSGEKVKPDEVTPPPYYPDTTIQRAAWANHYNAVRGTDAQVAEILEMLQKDRELENTIVFFFSDHGNPDSLRHKQFCYEGGVHVPLIIQGNHPRLPAGTVRSELTSGLDISATTLGLAKIPLPAYLHGQDLLAETFQPRDFVVSARDRCDYSIDRIRTVRTERFRYLRNGFPKRPLLQAQYRDDLPFTRELRQLHQEGKLTAFQSQLWFGERAEEELYDMHADPDQLRNLVGDADYAAEVERHRKILDTWIVNTSDQGQKAESLVQLKATFDLWKDKPIFKNATTNPEYDAFR